MALVVPNSADILMMKLILNAVGQDGGAAPAGGSRRLRLYTNNLTPGKGTVLSDITEASAAGYAAKVLSGSVWTFGTTGGVNSAVYSPQIFTFTSAVTVYGYFVTTAESSPQLLWAERLSNGPYPLPTGGGEVSVTARFVLN